MTKISRTLLAAAALFAAALIPAQAYAQASLFSVGKMGSSHAKGSQQPTVITSDTMDIDIANNVATLIGNVDVDDVEMNIKCHKMIIYLENKDVSAKESADSPEKGKQLRRVECIGDVVITRKVKLGAAEAKEGEQKALAGHADYDIATGTIVLSEDPVLIRGTTRINGTTITIFRESERMKVDGGTITTTQGPSDDEAEKGEKKSDGEKKK